MSIIDDLNTLDMSNPGIWPLPIKLIFFAIAFVGVLSIGWKVDIAKQQEELLSLEKKELKQINTLEKAHYKAANLNLLQEQMAVMQQSFYDMVRQLPNKAEVAGLLIDISQTGLASGLKFEQFKPMSQSDYEFYSELPINIVVKGDYHKFGKFISDIASLPRIVTVHDINITTLDNANKSDTGKPMLQMVAVAKTYNALDLEE